MNRERQLEEIITRVSEETGIPVSRIACCPTAGKDGIADGMGTVFFDDDDQEKRPLVVLLQEKIGEPASVSQQS